MLQPQSYLPPQSLDLEAAVLGAMISIESAQNKVLATLTQELVFYKPEHQLIFRVARELAQAGSAVDLLTMRQALKEASLLKRVGGPSYLAELTMTVNSAVHVETHCRILLQQYARRVVIEAGTLMQRHGFDEGRDPLDLVAEAQVQLLGLHTTLETRGEQTVASKYDEVFADLEVAVQQEGLTGVPTGLTELNTATGGWQNTDLIIMAARPGMGKTAAMLHFAKSASVECGIPTAIFSMEMPTKQLIQRMISAEVPGYTNAKIRHGKIDGGVDEVRYLAQRAARLKTDKLIIDDTPALSIHQLRAKCARLKAEKNVGLILVDYLQLMTGDKSRNREQEIGGITRGLKEMAKTLNVPVIALAQLSRSVESRGGEKRPQLSDLRESGSIEQDADVVVFLWRGEVYKIDEYSDGTPTAGTMLFDIAKHRNGAIGEVIAACKMDRGAFQDLDLGPVPAGERPMYVDGERVALGPLPASKDFADDDQDLPF